MLTPLSSKRDPFITKNDAIVYVLQFVAGCANGEHDRLLYHPDAFFIAHPNLNRQWYDPRISWQNKNNRSWFVQTFFVWLTDENHLSPAIEHAAFIMSVAISYNDAKKNWKQKVFEAVKRAAFSYGFNRLGFHSMYR